MLAPFLAIPRLCGHREDQLYHVAWGLDDQVKGGKP